MSSKPRSTFEREMQDPEFKKEFDRDYKEFLLSELILSLMQSDKKSVRELAKEAGVSPSVIQGLRSGKQSDVKLTNFLNISHACGYQVLLKKGRQSIHL